MRLISTHLKNFGKFKDRTLKFSSGVTVIRGENESGKTTLLLGILYCWFGSQVLDFPIDNYINNEDAGASAFKVTNVFKIEDVEYTCARGKSGAELRRDDVVIATNHAPVTTAIEELLGISPGKAGGTMFAKQNCIQGIISLGPTALADYIEKLAGFDQLDKMISTLSEKLEIGSTKHFESQLAIKQSQIEVIGDTGNEVEVADAENALESAIFHTAQCNSAWALAKERLDAIVSERSMLQERIQEAHRAVKARQLLLINAAPSETLPARIEAAERHIEKANEWLLYDSLMSMPERPADEWEGDVAGLEQELTLIQKILNENGKTVAGLLSTIKAEKAKQLTTTVCPYTRQVCEELSDLTTIERVNAEVDASVNALNEQIKELKFEDHQLNQKRDALLSIKNYQAKVESMIPPLGEKVSVQKDGVPWKLIWVGDPPPQVGILTEDPFVLKKQLAAAEIAKAQLKVLPETVDTTILEAKFKALALPDLDALQTQAVMALDAQTKAKQFLLIARTALEANKKKASLEAEVIELNGKIAKCQKDAALMKAVRASRLIVSELIWSKVLGGTSNYFSRMRGTPSKITRTSKGFAINNHPIVSGSTFDLLGVALLMTLAKLFSRCTILMLDEAGAGADAKRSAALLGTLASAGFDQILFITHKDADESACDNLLEL